MRLCNAYSGLKEAGEIWLKCKAKELHGWKVRLYRSEHGLESGFYLLLKDNEYKEIPTDEIYAPLHNAMLQNEDWEIIETKPHEGN